MPTSALSKKPMDKIYRDGADISIAFTSRMKRNAVASAAGGSLRQPDQDLQSTVAGGQTPARVSPASQRSLIKRVLRKMARSLYYLLRPVTRPLAFRLRSFLAGGQIQLAHDLHQETLQKLAKTEQSMRSELIALRTQLRQELRGDRGESRKLLTAEMSYTRELVQQLVKDRSAAQQADRAHDERRLEQIETYAAASASRNAVQCGKDEILVRTAVGYMLCPAQDHALLAQLLDVGELEAGTRLLIQRLLVPGSTYIDVGANIGMHVIAAARAMQGKGSIACFEPYEPTAQLLRKSIFLNGFAHMATVHQVAVSSRNGSQPLFLGQTTGHHSLFPLDEWATSGKPPVETRLVRLDDVMPQGAHVDVIKIDAEGAELDVLAGANALLANNPEIGLIVECGAAHLRRSGIDLSEWLGAFASMGFEWKAIDPDAGHLASFPEDQLRDRSSVNLFMARSNAKLWRLAESKDE